MTKSVESPQAAEELLPPERTYVALEGRLKLQRTKHDADVCGHEFLTGVAMTETGVSNVANVERDLEMLNGKYVRVVVEYSDKPFRVATQPQPAAKALRDFGRWYMTLGHMNPPALAQLKEIVPASLLQAMADADVSQPQQDVKKLAREAAEKIDNNFGVTGHIKKHTCSIYVESDAACEGCSDKRWELKRLASIIESVFATQPAQLSKEEAKARHRE